MLSSTERPPLDMPIEPVRVALVITDLEVGGAEKCLTQLALGVRREEFLPEVYCLQPRPQGEKAKLVDQLESTGVPVHLLNATSAWGVIHVVRALRREFLRQRPHVVQTFLYHANVVGILAARLAAIPWVFTGIRVADPNPYRRQIERWLYGFAAMNFCVSRSVAAAYQTSGFKVSDARVTTADNTPPGFKLLPELWRRKLQVIPNAVDTAVYATAHPAGLASDGCGPERRVLLFVGRLAKQKGLDWLLACLPDLFARLPDHDLVLAGDGPQRDSLQQLAARLKVAERVHFLGWRADVPQLLKRADLLVLPSRYEGMPNVVLEALAAGVPVVATRVEGAEEILGGLAATCLVGFGQSQDLIQRISELATNEEVRAALIDQGRNRVACEFSIPAMVERYTQFWKLPTSSASAAATCRASP